MTKLQPMDKLRETLRKRIKSLAKTVDAARRSNSVNNGEMCLLQSYRMLSRALEQAEATEPMPSPEASGDEPTADPFKGMRSGAEVHNLIVIENHECPTRKRQLQRMQQALGLLGLENHELEHLGVEAYVMQVNWRGYSVYPETVLYERPEPGSFVAFDEKAYASLYPAQRQEIELIYGSLLGCPILLCNPKDPKGPRALRTPSIEPNNPLLPLLLDRLRMASKCRYSFSLMASKLDAFDIAHAVTEVPRELIRWEFSSAPVPLAEMQLRERRERALTGPPRSARRMWAKLAKEEARKRRAEAAGE